MPAEYRQRVERLAAVVGLENDLFRPLRTYSGGMKRKLEIIRSLMHRPADPVPRRADVGPRPGEPARASGRYLRDVRNEDGTTVFLTTHYLEEAEEADRVCVVDHGRIAMIGTPDHMKRELLERSIILDAVDRDALLAELDGLGFARRSTPPASFACLRRRHRPVDHRAHPHAAERPARPRTQPRGGVRRADLPARRRPHERRRRDRGDPPGAAAGIRSAMLREANATFAIAWREILSAIRNPVSIVVTIIIPVIFMGILGGSISQNLGAALPYAYLPFMLIGMIANTLYQGTITGMTNLVEERENDFTAELFVAPISRYTVLVGKMLGSAMAAMISLVGVLAMIVVMQIPMDPGDLLRVLALSPILAVAGGALGILFIGFVQDPKVAGLGVVLLVFPQMFLSGALIPITDSTGLLGILSKLMPMTYSIDLARNIFYAGKPEYAFAVLHPFWLDLAITAVVCVVFIVVGTVMFVRRDRNRYPGDPTPSRRRATMAAWPSRPRSAPASPAASTPTSCARSSGCGSATRSPRTRRDIDGLIATLAPDCVYEIVPTGQRWEGHDGARAFYTELFGAFPDNRFALTDIVVGPQGVFEAAQLTGTNLGPWAGVRRRGCRSPWRS